jgi:S1-C subfamily serine protease
MIDPLLLTATRLLTFNGQQGLTNASGFFFERDGRLFLVTSLHVVCDAPSDHFPDRLEIELHNDATNLASSIGFSVLLYRDGRSVWKQGQDSVGDVDIVVIELDRTALPPTIQIRAFTPAHLIATDEKIEIGSSVLIVGFPLGFHDTLHHLPVVRYASIASAFGYRFRGHGYFLTDARTHRGTSGAPVALRASDPALQLGDLPWKLLGVHASRLDAGTRDPDVDEALGLNCAWYADMLLTLTA